jgi:hypothetical protein
MANKKAINSFRNVYEEIPNLKNLSSSYKDFDKIRFELPFRMMIVGSSGSYKTNWLMNLIHKMKCFTRIYLFARVLDEPLYNLLRAKMRKLMKKRKDNTLFFESNTLDNFPSFGKDGEAKDNFSRDEQNLIIIDDLVLEQNQINPVNAFVFGRKFNISCVYISQNYYKTPITIRKNSDIIVLKKINSQKDLKRILSEYSGSTCFTDDELLRIYKSITDPTAALVLDINNRDPKLRVRVNFEPISSVRSTVVTS